MKVNRLYSVSKIGILILNLWIGTNACSIPAQHEPGSLIRFEELAFTIPPADLSDTIHTRYENLVPFFRIFNEEVIRIGPDSLSGYIGQLSEFVNDPLIRQVYSEVTKSHGIWQTCVREVDEALGRWTSITGRNRPDILVTFISGFNQSFITLPGCLGLGVDNYLGSESPSYQGLSIPVYLKKRMNPENLSADAVRAWLYTEFPPPAEDGGFLGRMIYEGKIYYSVKKLLPSISDKRLFQFTEEQLQWCKSQEVAMWKYLAEQKILFSSDRLTIRKFIEEAPFTRDFGQESPGRAGIWIGYRIVSSYVKANGIDLADLVDDIDAKKILSASKYHP